MVPVVPRSTFFGLRYRPRRSIKDASNVEAENELDIKERVGVTCARTYYPRRCKRFNLSFFDCISDELLYEILVRLMAQDIYFGARLVCRKWYHITRTKYFIQQHLKRTSYGLLYVNESEEPVFITAREDGKGINMYKHIYTHRINDPIRSAWHSCNGLMVEYEIRYELVYYVTNASTGQTFRLPPYPYSYVCMAYSYIGYDATSMTYKVVVPNTNVEQQRAAIFTLGVDESWRVISTDHLSDLGKSSMYHYPIVTEGFVHWHARDSTGVVTLNLVTEMIREFPPPVVLKKRTRSCCLSTGRYLSLFILHSKFVWEVFEMKPETGEWRKLPNICLEGQNKIKGLVFKGDDVDIMPCGWLKYPEVLALRVQRAFIIFYNFITCEIGAEKLSFSRCSSKIELHKNSLVWFCGF